MAIRDTLKKGKPSGDQKPTVTYHCGHIDLANNLRGQLCPKCIRELRSGKRNERETKKAQTSVSEKSTLPEGSQYQFTKANGMWAGSLRVPVPGGELRFEADGPRSVNSLMAILVKRFKEATGGILSGNEEKSLLLPGVRQDAAEAVALSNLSSDSKPIIAKD